MHLLTAISNNIGEWRALRRYDHSKPRLPLPYAFGEAFLLAGHKLSALDICSQADRNDIAPFEALYHKDELADALRQVDVAALWGSDALRELIKQTLLPGSRRNILYFTYIFAPKRPALKQRLYNFALKMVAGRVLGLVLMTGEQVRSARTALAESVPIIQLRCGIDTAFYRDDTGIDDVPKHELARVGMLLNEPYVIMPGDELRFNDDAIRFVEQSGIRLSEFPSSASRAGPTSSNRILP